MRIDPLSTKPRRPRPVALVEAGHRTLVVHSQDGTQTARGPRRCHDLLTRYGSHRLFVNSGLTALRHTTGALAWTASTWRGRVTSMHLDGGGVDVTSLRGVLTDSASPYDDLVEALAWIEAQGVAVASPTTMSFNLWRSSLDGPVTIGADPDLGRRALFGGRQEISRPGVFKHMRSLDITAAYPHSMGTRPYALALAEVDSSTRLDPEVAGLARARVTVPLDLPYPPLPVRIAPDLIQWQWGYLDGVWSWGELAAAAELGCHVAVAQSWAPAREADLFARWWRIIEAGRGLAGAAGRFVKMVANCLWGMFGMRGDDRTLIAWKDDAGTKTYTIRAENRRLPHARTAHVAAETSSRVRRRLLLEGLYCGPGTPIHVDTDGMIVRRSHGLPEPHGEAPGQWRVKQKMLRVEVRAPQLYRWWCALCGEAHPDAHYVAAGCTPDVAREVFRTTPRGRLQLSWRPGLDTCLPPAHSDETMIGFA